MIAYALLMTLAQAPTVEIPPPQLIDTNGMIITLNVHSSLAPGTVCLTAGKAKSVRDDIVAKNAKIEVYEANQGPGWGVTLGVAGGAAVVVGVVVGIVAYGTGKSAPR